MKSYEELMRVTLERGLKPIEKITVAQWAAANRIISAGNAEPGRWRNERVPHMIEPMRAITQKGIHKVVLKCASQLSKSELLQNLIGRFATVDPCTIIMVQPTLEMAEDFSKTRISAMIRDTACLREIFKREEEEATVMMKPYVGGRLILTGSNSPAGLASRPARIVLCDEVDRFAKSAGSEGDPMALIEKRMSTFWNWLMVMTSTPTVEGESRIDYEYNLGTQEEWQVRCPNCEQYHLIEYKDITEKDKWRCPDCGLEYSEQEMKKAAAKYVVKNPGAIGIRSFHVNGFASPWVSWKRIMREWREARGQEELEKVVYNTRFGLSYKYSEVEIEDNEMMNRREQYGERLPEEVKAITAAVDVQDNRLEVEICGWTAEEECYGLKVEKIMGSPGLKGTWEMLSVILNRTFEKASGEKLKIARTFIDSGGHFSGEVYEYCRQKAYEQVYAIKGKGGVGLALIHKITTLKNGILLVTIGVNEGKQAVYSRLEIKEGEKRFHYPKGHEYGYDEVYFKQLMSEQKVQKVINGKIVGVYEIKKRGMRNEALDLRVYNLACFETIKEQIKSESKQENKRKVRNKTVNQEIY